MLENSTLNAIGLKYGTDKASSTHNYLDFYEIFFSPLRNKELTVLEIGVFNGASLKTWEEYFPNSRIIGADIMQATKRFERDRVTIELLDQSNIEELTRVALKYGPFDIIIEDGSHMWEHQITSLRTLFPFLKDQGIYIVEDLHTNYGPTPNKFQGVASSTCVEYLKAWLDLCVADVELPISKVEDAFLRTYGNAVQFITFYRRACLIKKKFALVARGSAGQPIVGACSVGAWVPVHILAHISSQGDVLGTSGFVNFDSEEFAFQGISIDAEENVLEYRVRGPDGSWSDWSPNNSFVGTRGESKLLTGITIRLKSTAKHRFALRVFGRFVGAEYPVEVSEGHDCMSLSGSALCGIQIKLAELK
jgi:hypothetical protein